MRGVLECWIRQAGRVEQFKGNQSPAYVLQSKFQLETGDEVEGEEECFHLQVNS